MTRNDEIAARFEEFADLLEAKGVEYKPNTYRRAADNIRDYPTPIEELAAEGADAVERIDRVGDALSSKVIEYFETGSIAELEDLREQLPVEMVALTSVEGVGPKTVGRLYEELGVTTLDELEVAARNGDIRELSGFGAKTEENILENIPFAKQAQERERLGDARPVADDVLEHLRETGAVERAEAAGSIRRWQDTIGDVDVLVASTDAEAVVEAFTDWPGSDAVIEAGTGKASVRANGIRVDLRVTAPEDYGAALQYFTGSKAHNVHLRNIAIDRDLKMNEYGIFDVSAVPADEDSQRAGERLGGETEAEMYDALGLPWIPPELREDNGEIEAAREGTLPDLIEEGALRGDLHTHTDWSDGGATIEEMVAGAAERGYEYHCVTDHAEGPGVFGNAGLSDDEIREQADAIAAVAEAAPVEILHGVEANVDADGEVTTSDEVLADLDIVVASPHSALDQGREEATERLCRAVEHPSVDVLGHPTGRLINNRAGLSVDHERIAEAAAEHGTALEINANPARLDLSGDAVRIATEAGAKIAIDTDAHTPSEFDNARYGIHTARRGWAEDADVINTFSLEDLRAFLHR
ncbi:DNA polymerase/3'-5' exonuclease PolX [Haloferacaceae archaeon DSL9]